MTILNMEVGTLAGFSGAVVTLTLCCFNSFKKLFRSIISIVIMLMLRFYCCLFPCELCRKWEFYILVQWFSCYCVTDFEVNMILTRCDKIYASVSMIRDAEDSIEVFVKTLMIHYRSEFSKYMNENVRSILLEKIIDIIINISNNEKSHAKSAFYIFNFLKDKDKMNHDIEVILSLARLFSRIQNSERSDIKVLVELSRIKPDYPIKILCETVNGIIRFDRHHKWSNVLRLQLSIFEAVGVINLTKNTELTEIVNETIKNMCRVRQNIPEDSLIEYLKILRSLTTFVISRLNCREDLTSLVDYLKLNECTLEELDIIENYLDGKRKMIYYDPVL